jgi:uncharacterized protein
VRLRRRDRPRSEDEEAVTIYYASDVHGSDVCWRKFLRAGTFYKAHALVMGGDLTGKAIVPVARQVDGRHTARFLSEDRVARDDEELGELLDAIRLNGMYPWVAPAGEIAAMGGDADAQARLFDTVIADEVRRWVDLADERLTDGAPEAYVIAGNDDPWYVDDVLRDSDRLTFCDDQIVQLGEHEMISLSLANPTPWDSPRELPEDELYQRLHGLAEQLQSPRTAIFNLHVPPYDSGLDRAVEIDDELRIKVSGGSTNEVPVGSTAVRQIIEEYQPALALHGHIHESRGATRIGETLAINSGSEYNTGRIHGVVVHLLPDRVGKHQFVIG